MCDLLRLLVHYYCRCCRRQQQQHRFPYPPHSLLLLLLLLFSRHNFVVASNGCGGCNQQCPRIRVQQESDRRVRNGVRTGEVLDRSGRPPFGQVQGVVLRDEFSGNQPHRDSPRLQKLIALRPICSFPGPQPLHGLSRTRIAHPRGHRAPTGLSSVSF